MPSDITCFKVFIASPGGLAEERKAFRDEIQEYNEAEAIPRSFIFRPIGWEDTLGAVGRPQTIINEDVRASDYFILLLWNRWGSPPDVKSSHFSSGTEEEYHVAMECYNSDEFPMRQLVLMFKAVDPAQLNDPGQQLQRVLDFRKDIESNKTHLFDSFDTTDIFSKLLRRHLAAWLREEEQGETAEKEHSQNLRPPAVENLVSIPEQQLRPSSWSLIQRAWALADEGRLTEAEIEFARSIIGHSQPGPVIQFGRFLARIGRLDQAKMMFEEAAKIAEDQRDPMAVSTACGYLGMVLFTRGDLEGAESMYRRSLHIEEKMGRLEALRATMETWALCS